MLGLFKKKKMKCRLCKTETQVKVGEGVCEYCEDTRIALLCFGKAIEQFTITDEEGLKEARALLWYSKRLQDRIALWGREKRDYIQYLCIANENICYNIKNYGIKN